ncbi:hypothetical protein JXA88_08135 [Candidatus Fermentibacteria bacterium]|nr:hypothetical protein [Candidatus Fermentibacteria bacterium]
MRVVISVLMLSMLIAVSLAEIPQVITYQGKVSDAGGAPVADGDYTMTFSIHDAASGGTSLWSSGALTVAVNGGVFSVLLGESPQPTLSLDFSADYWVEVNIAGDVQAPRVKMGSVGYAYMASGIVPQTEVVGSSGYPTLKGSNSGAGAGLRGESDLGIGVRGETQATDSKGVYGVANATEGQTTGVYGVSQSTGGTGVVGEATATTGVNYGIRGMHVSNNGAGVLGYASGTTGVAAGVAGYSSSSTGSGVAGRATSSTGVNYGLYGSSNSTGGFGVYASANASSGTNYGVYGTTNSTDGFAGYFDGHGHFSGNVGIGTDSPDRSLSVVGYVRGANAADEAEYVEIAHEDSNAVINWNGDGRFDIRYADTTRVTVEQDGDVGIGTTTPGATLDVRGSAVFNEDGGNNDFRVEGDTRANLLFVDASLDQVGIGTALPNALLDVRGDAVFNEGGGNNDFRVEGDTDQYLFSTDAQHDRIGIGTEYPEERLDIRIAGGALRCQVHAESGEPGELTVYGVNENRNVILSSTNDYDNNGMVAVCRWDGIRMAGMQVDAAGDGIVWGDTKSFRMANPKDPGTEIWYACIEGPEAAAYLRGTARLENGRATISFPEHFQSVAIAEGMTVQLTPLSAECKGLAVTRKSIQGIDVEELWDGTGTYDFDYTVMAVRTGHEDYQVIRPVEREDAEERPGLASEL